MARTKTKPTLKRRRTYRDDPTPMSYQGWGLNEIGEEVRDWIGDAGSLVLFVKICELLKPRRIEEITYDHDARAVLAFAAFTGPQAGAHGEWEEIYKRIDDYIEVARQDESRIHPLVNELHFDALLAGAKALLAAADYLVAEVEAYDTKHGKEGA